MKKTATDKRKERAAWRSNGNTETANAVVTGRDLDHCLFCDDFDWYDTNGPSASGNLWRWTSTVGMARTPGEQLPED